MSPRDAKTTPDAGPANRWAARPPLGGRQPLSIPLRPLGSASSYDRSLLMENTMASLALPRCPQHASHDRKDPASKRRPPQSFRALTAPAAQALARYRLPENKASHLADQRAPAWVFLTGLKLNLSSTGLRNPDGSWKQG